MGHVALEAEVHLITDAVMALHVDGGDDDDHIPALGRHMQVHAGAHHLADVHRGGNALRGQLRMLGTDAQGHILALHVVLQQAGFLLGGQLHLLAGQKVELAAEKEARLLKNDVQSQDVTLGVRPEHTELTPEGVPATVDVSEMMGSSVHLHVSAEGRDVIIIVPTIDMKGHYSIGDKVHFSFKGNVAHVFSKETEKNLEW